jgi:serine phosphatase RsbU (regulator of sigma subunit)
MAMAGGTRDVEAVSNGALRLALQKSEGRRLGVLLLLLAVTFVVNVVRHRLRGDPLGGAVFVPLTALVLLLGGYAAALQVATRRATARGRLIRMPIWTASVVFESLVPTIAILILQRKGPLPKLDTLTSPALVQYGTFILLSILRLRPGLCLLGGLVAAAGHLALFLRVAATSDPAVPAAEYPYYFSYPIYLVLAGVGAALVASVVRDYFLGSLREAATRRSLDRLEDEMKAAREIQQRLMPRRPPAFHGFDIAGFNRPADETGGDYYDWQRLPDGRLAILIADVAGHGLGPALLMAVCRAYARASLADRELVAAFARVNAHLHGDVSDGRFVTLAAAVVSPDGRCELLSAGHGPILLYRARDQSTELLGAGGAPLGILDPGIYGEPHRFEFARGDVLLFVTDGFVEARRADGEFYETLRLTACLKANAGRGAQELITAIEADVAAFTGAEPQGDDMTAVAIRRE